MKHQQVSVDYWAMGKAMLLYGALTVVCWVMLRLFNTVFTLPRRLRAQQDQIQNSLKDLQKRFPDLNITEEDLENAEKELEKITNEHEEELRKKKEIEETRDEVQKTELDESKKTI